MIHKLIRYIKRRIVNKIKKTIASIGNGSIINYPIVIDNPQNLIIDEYVYLGPDAWISCYTEVRIKRGVIIGPRVKIYTGNHNYENTTSIPYDHVTLAKSVIINENVWIGGDVIIMPGVVIGEGCVVAGGSVVTKSFAECCVIGGNPARIIKTRDRESYYKLKLEDKIYLKMKQEGIFRRTIETVK